MTAILITFCASLLGSAAQSTIGFGSALVLSPVLFLILGPQEAVVCTLAIVTWISPVMLVAERDRLALDRGASLGLAGPALPGVIAGALLLGAVGKAYLQIGVGAVVLVAVALQMRAARRPRPPAGQLRFRPSAIPHGLAAGVLNGAVSTGGPPLAIWLRSVQAGPSEIRHTLALVFVFINLTTIAAIALLDGPRIDGEWLRALGGGMAGIPAGYWLGARVIERIDERTFGRAVAVTLVGVAVVSVVSGLSGL